MFRRPPFKACIFLEIAYFCRFKQGQVVKRDQRFFAAALFFILFSSAGRAGSIWYGYRRSAVKIKTAYNMGRYDSIFNMCSPLAQRPLTRQKPGYFFRDVLAAHGLILSLDSVDFVMPATEVFFDVHFEKGELDFYLQTDDENRINSLFFLPHKEGRGTQ